MECLWTKIISKNLPHIWASTLVQHFWTKCYLGYSLLGMILVKSIQFRYIYWNSVNLRWIIDNVIIHHNINVFIRNTIFMENLVGMAYISLNTRKWTCHLKFSLKRASNYFHSQGVIMVTRRRTLQKMVHDQLSYLKHLACLWSGQNGSQKISKSHSFFRKPRWNERGETFIRKWWWNYNNSCKSTKLTFISLSNPFCF